jgi:hypothetical protein
MNANEFVTELLSKLKKINYILKMRYMLNAPYGKFVGSPYPLMINADLCRMEAGKCFLGLSGVETSDEKCIDNLLKLKKLFWKNKVNKTDQMFVRSDFPGESEEIYPILGFKLNFDKFNFADNNPDKSTWINNGCIIECY